MKFALVLLAVLPASTAFADSGKSQSLKRTLARHEKSLAADQVALSKEKEAHNATAIKAREKSIRFEHERIHEIESMLKKNGA